MGDAIVAFAQGELEEARRELDLAEASFKRALQIQSRFLSPSHPRTLRLTVALARALVARGLREEGKQLARQLLETLDAHPTLQSTHPVAREARALAEQE
jgi:hypothetical protein